MSNTKDATTSVGTATAGESNVRLGKCPVCDSKEVVDFLVAPDRFHLRNVVYRLVRCLSCTCVWLADPPKSQDMGLHYDEDYHKAIVKAGEGSAEIRWKNQRNIISRYKNGGRLLDIGCSSGGFLSTMKGTDWQLFGIEMEPSTAQRAKSASGAEVFVGDAVEALFPEGSFDVITSFDVLEHVYDPVQFLTKVLEWLKPGGIFYAILPNISSWEARIFGTYWYGLELPRHLFHFSPRSVRSLMNLLGLEEVYLATPPWSYAEYSLGYVLSNLQETLGLSTVSLAKRQSQGFIWKAMRKSWRLIFLAPWAHITSLADAGPSMHLVFRKPTADSE